MRKSYKVFTQAHSPVPGAVWYSLDLCRKLGPKTSMVLAILMDYQVRAWPEAEREDKGWFSCTNEQLKAFCPELLDLHTQTREFRVLEDEKFIRRKLVGMPPNRYMWIDWDRILELSCDEVPTNAVTKTRLRRS